MSFSNGKAVRGVDVVLIPQSKYLTTNGPQYLAAAALVWLLAAARAFHEATGVALYITEGYRDYATQRAIFVARYTPSIFGTKQFEGKRWRKRIGADTAAVPGTSIHGFGLAVDLGSGIASSFTSPHHLAWLIVSAIFGWLNTGTGFGEPWHMEWALARTGTATPTISPADAGPSTPIPNEEEDDMYTDADRARDEATAAQTKQNAADIKSLRSFANELPKRVSAATVEQIERSSGMLQSLRSFANEIPKRVASALSK